LLLATLVLLQPLNAQTPAEAEAPTAKPKAGAKQVVEVKKDYQGQAEGTAPKVVNPKKVILTPKTVQRIKSPNGEQLEIAFERIHPAGKFPEVRIQGIPFKMEKRGEKIAFTWNQAGYELTWADQGDEVILLSSQAFAQAEEAKLSPDNKEAKHALLKKGLVVTAKRKNGKTARLEVTNLEQDKAGKMTKFSTKTQGDENSPEFQMENNIMPPETFKQYEKGIDEEILFIFTSNRNGQIFVYYR